MGVTTSGQHLKDTIVDSKNRHIKGTSAKVKHKDILLTTFLVQSICNCSCCGLIDNAFNCQPSNGACILCSLPLSIIEVRWHCHNSMSDGLAQEGLCRLLHLVKNHGTDLLRRKLLYLALHGNTDVWFSLVVDNVVRDKFLIPLHLFVFELPTDKPFHVIDGTSRVRSGLILCSVTNQSFL
mmetsp:Transcript_5811/g.14115  ORF Transcript_5811/g.14115 Transcript_5811/m.14115 type:complete len:181 (+) Transcript_5811:282-824(+)